MSQPALSGLFADTTIFRKTFRTLYHLSLVLVLTKFDLFGGLEPERRKTTARLLRLVAHRAGASLNTYAQNDVASARRLRELLSHYAYGTRFPKEAFSEDLNKGLGIPAGGDSFGRIWPSCNPAQFSLEYFGRLWESQIGMGAAAKTEEAKDNENNPAEDPNFAEPGIDSQHSVLLEELRAMEETLREQGDVFLVVGED